MPGIQFLITIGVFPLMSFTGFYLYRYINQKLRAAETWAQVIVFGLLLFVGIAAILSGGFLLMAWLYQVYRN